MLSLQLYESCAWDDRLIVQSVCYVCQACRVVQDSLKCTATKTRLATRSLGCDIPRQGTAVESVCIRVILKYNN
jgi:hypothetical protein